MLRAFARIALVGSASSLRLGSGGRVLCDAFRFSVEDPYYSVTLPLSYLRHYQGLPRFGMLRAFAVGRVGFR